MEVSDAVDLVARLQRKPGYRLTALNFTHRIQDAIKLIITENTVASEDHEHRIVNSVAFVIEVGHLESIGLVREVLDRVIQHQTHEWREFLRLDDQAPLHPHTHDGIARWGNPQYDYTYGALGTAEVSGA